jgi:hypothetical protein
MGITGTFRILSVEHGTISLNPISREGDRFVEQEEEALDVDYTKADSEITQVVSFLEPGHLVQATVIESDGAYRFDSLEHRGGMDLIELDPRTIPYVLEDCWELDERCVEGEDFRVPLSAIDPLEDTDTFTGELVVRAVSESDTSSWLAFRRGGGAEAVYGGFETETGVPEEVFIGNPHGASYWYAILFPEFKTNLAQRIRAQYSHLYDDHYRPNPTCDLSRLIDESKLPDDPDQEPKAVFGPDYHVHSSRIPERFGQDTVILLAEFMYYGSQFEFGLFDDSETTLNPDQALTYSPDEIIRSRSSLMTTYRFYTSLLTSLHDSVEEYPETDIETLVAEGTIPDPELLYRTRIKFNSLVHEFESYLQKMEQVPIETYLVEQFSGSTPEEQLELRDQYEVEGFPLMIRHVLHDLEQQLDDLKEVLKVADYVATTEWTDAGLVYDIQAEQKAYDYVTQHQESTSDGMMPADLGGDDPGVFMTLMGRLSRRHDWLDTSSMGAMGGLLSSFGEAMRESSN